MRLRYFEISNFKCIKKLGVDWDELLVFIGENNCGKLSLLQALSWFLSGSAIKDVSLFWKHETAPDNAIELVGFFDQLSDSEKAQIAIKSRTYNEEWILKKRYWYEDGGRDGQDKGAWKEQLFSFSTKETFANWPATDNAWNSFPDHYQLLIQQIADRPSRPNNAAREALKVLVRSQRPDLIVNCTPEWVPNPGGGGNWKSNANSIIPRAIYVH